MQNIQKRSFDIFSLIALLLALWIAGLRLQVTNWAPNLDKVEMGLIMAVLIGLVIGYSKFDQRTSRWMGIAFSVLGLTWLLNFVMEPELVWAEKMLALSEDIWISLGKFFRNEPAETTTLFLVIMIVSYWCIGYFAGFQMARYRKPWLPLGILFIILLVIDYFPPYIKSRYLYSGLFVLFGIFLIGRLYYLSSMDKWQRKNVMVDYGAGLDFLRSVLLTGFLLVMVAWGIPGLIKMLVPGTKERQKLVEFWDPLQERFSNAVFELQAPQPTNADFFAKDLFLGSEVSQGSNPVFKVTPSRGRGGGFQYYWRGHTYDHFDNGKWENKIETYYPIKMDEWPLIHPDWGTRKLVRLEYEWQYSRSRILYMPSIPLSINRPVKIVGEQNVIDKGEYLDDVVVFVDNSIYAGEKLEVKSWVSEPTISDMRAAGEIYPFWVNDRYLQLPESLDQAIIDLAEEITQDAETPFDKVQAVTEYLRKEIQYEKSIGTPPEGRDLLYWFLLENKKGFCNYYATAEVILLRSLGIPSRLAVGFAQGELLDDDETYLVRLNDSHAWPEVYFPGIGWVEFEPTAAQPSPDLIMEMEAVEEDGVSSFSTADGVNPSPFKEERFFDEFLEEGVYSEEVFLPRLYYPGREWLIFVSTMLLLGVVFWLTSIDVGPARKKNFSTVVESLLLRRGWETPSWIEFLSYRSSLDAMERQFSEIAWMLDFLSIDNSPGATPAEQIDLLNHKLESGAENATVLLGEYEKFAYSDKVVNREAATKAYRSLWVEVIKFKVRGLVGYHRGK